jgi:hypothetical protein
LAKNGDPFKPIFPQACCGRFDESSANPIRVHTLFIE